MEVVVGGLHRGGVVVGGLVISRGAFFTPKLIGVLFNILVKHVLDKTNDNVLVQRKHVCITTECKV